MFISSLHGVAAYQAWTSLHTEYATLQVTGHNTDFWFTNQWHASTRELSQMWASLQYRQSSDSSQHFLANHTKGWWIEGYFDAFLKDSSLHEGRCVQQHLLHGPSPDRNSSGPCTPSHRASGRQSHRLLYVHSYKSACKRVNHRY